MKTIYRTPCVLQTLAPMLMIQKSLKQSTQTPVHLLYKQILPTSKKATYKNVNLKLNASKCKVLRVTRKHYHNKVVYPYKLSCETILTSTDCERDLGALTSSDLTWSKHIDHQCHKANKILGYVRRSTLDIKRVTVRRTLYLSLVRAQLCYGSQIWTPQTITTIQQTERLQRRATKFILNLPFRCNTIYEERLLQLNLIPLSYWHDL